MASPQTELSEKLLDLCRRMLLSDGKYVERLKRHYRETCPTRGPKPERHPSAKVLRRLRERRRKR